MIADIGGRRFEWGARTYVMGIINVTPDSFSGDGVGTDLDRAVAQGLRMVQEGADSFLILQGRALAWSPAGYREAQSAIKDAMLLTPPSTLRA